MPKLAVTATTTTEIRIAPQLKKQLLTKLNTYASMKQKRDELDAAMKLNRVEVEEIMEKVGETSIAVDGFKTTLIAPIKRRLDPKKLVKLGVSMDTINAATVETSGTPYVKITVPGAKAVEGDDDER